MARINVHRSRMQYLALRACLKSRLGNTELGSSVNPRAGMPALQRNAGIPACGFWRHPCRQLQVFKQPLRKCESVARNSTTHHSGGDLKLRGIEGLDAAISQSDIADQIVQSLGPTGRAIRRQGEQTR
jgi:hypothetical protein